MQKPKDQKPPLKTRTPGEPSDWSFTKERIGQELKKYYQACTTEELPPRLLAVIKTLEERAELSGEHFQETGEMKD